VAFIFLNVVIKPTEKKLENRYNSISAGMVIRGGERGGRRGPPLFQRWRGVPVCGSFALSFLHCLVKRLMSHSRGTFNKL